MANSFLPAGSVGDLSDVARLPMGVDPLLIKVLFIAHRGLYTVLYAIVVFN
jgi:hypothetical protein